MNYYLLIAKRSIESLFIFPFILLGRCIAFFKPMRQEYDIFFFFPFYHTGGAENIHRHIAKATGGKNCIIFFTRKSKDKTYYQDFIASGCSIRDISRYTDNKWLYFLNLIFRGIITGYINRQHTPILVFNGQSNFGYKISPWVSKNIPQVELIHAISSFSYIRIPFIGFYRKSITVSKVIIEKHRALYRKIGVPEVFFSRFDYIMNRIPLPDPSLEEKDYHTGPMKVLFVGRGTVEKRPGIVSAIAKAMQDGKSEKRIVFGFAGNVEDGVPASEREYGVFYGNISDPERLNKLYEAAHVLVIPSLTEGAPLVFMEAMAHGLAIVSTPVGNIPDHMENGKTGYVTTSLTDDKEVVEEMIGYLAMLEKDRALLEHIGIHNIKYAYQYFDISSFYQEYQSMVKSMMET